MLTNLRTTTYHLVVVQKRIWRWISPLDLKNNRLYRFCKSLINKFFATHMNCIKRFWDTLMDKRFFLKSSEIWIHFTYWKFYLFRIFWINFITDFTLKLVHFIICMPSDWGLNMMRDSFMRDRTGNCLLCIIRNITF